MKNKLSQLDINFIINGIRKFLKERAFRIILFGSFMSGQTRKTSDIDIAIEAPQPINLTQIGYINEYFEESDFPSSIDIIDLSRANKSFRDKVLREGKVIFETSS